MLCAYICGEEGGSNQGPAKFSSREKELRAGFTGSFSYSDDETDRDAERDCYAADHDIE
jgi:hypothetical protein